MSKQHTLTALSSLIFIGSAINGAVDLPRESKVEHNSRQKVVLGIGVAVAATTIGLAAHGIGEKLDFYSKCHGCYAGFVAAFAGMAGYIAYCTMRTHSAEGMVQRAHTICINADQKLLDVLHQTEDADLIQQLSDMYADDVNCPPLVSAYQDICSMRTQFAQAKDMMFQIKDCINNPLSYERDLYIEWLDEQLPVVENAIGIIGQDKQYQEQAKAYAQSRR